MTTTPSSKPFRTLHAAALALALILPLAAAPLARALDVPNGALITVSSTNDIGLLSTLNFTGTSTATSGTVFITAGSNLVFDNSGLVNNRLLVGANNAGAFLLGSGATLTISAMSGYKSPVVGAAMNVAAGGSLIFAVTDSTSQYIFRDNRVGIGTSGSDNGGSGSVISAASAYLEFNNALFLSNTSFSKNDAASAVYNTGAGSVTKINNSVFRNNTTTGGGNAGAIGVGTGNSLFLNNVLFDSNWADGNGGAITVATGTLNILNSTFLNNYSKGTNGGGVFLVNGNNTIINVANSLFQGNYNLTTSTANSGGGVFGTNNASTFWITASNCLFLSNTANAGGVVNFRTATGVQGSFVAVSSTFKNNASIATTFGGGVFFTLFNTSTFKAVNSLFEGNTAVNDGGVATTNNANMLRFEMNNVLFTSNTAGNNGGALSLIWNNTISTAMFTDVSFIDNTAKSGTGGAVFMTAANTTYTISATTSSTIAGNTANGVSNSIFSAGGTTSTMTFNIGDSGTLLMYDPMRAVSITSNTITINKTGAGLWVLGGTNAFAPGATSGYSNFTVTTGTLQLLGAGKSTYKGTPIAPGAINITTSGTFILRAAAALSVGGGNIITAPVINLENNANIFLDMGGIAPLATPLLTLNATTLASNWNQTLDFLNIDTNPAEASLYNLITLGTGTIPATALDTLFTTGLPNSNYRLRLSTNSTTLQLYYSIYADPRSVINWSGALDPALGSWSGSGNWLLATDNTTPLAFTKGDIVNLADLPAGGPANTTITIDTIGNPTLTAMYVSGTANYTIAGTNNIIADSAAGLFTGGTTVATGQLVLGAKARADGSQTDPTPYAGTLTLNNGANDFHGGIVINTGALVGNNLTLGAGTAGITIASAGTLTFSQTAAGAYAAPIRGAGTLIKTDTAALTLNANSAAYTGATHVDTGALLLAGGAALGGSINVASAATLGGSGTAAGAVTLAPGGILQIGTGTTGGQTFSILGNLAISASSTLDYTSGITNTLRVGGAISLAGESTLKLGPVTTTGSYALINATSGLATLNLNWLDVNYRGNPLTAGSDYTLSAAGNQLWINFATIPLGGNNVISWSGAAGDGLFLASANWTAFGHIIPFAQGDILNFANVAPAAGGTTSVLPEPGAPHAIHLTGPASVAAIYASGTDSYVISGDGPITINAAPGATELAGDAAAIGKLVLGKATIESIASATLAPYTGTLSFLNTGSNNFAGGIEINSGALRVLGNDQIGILTINGSSATDLTGAITPNIVLNAGALIVASGGTLVFDDNYAGLNTLTVTTTNPISIIAEPGATFGISHNGAPAGDGGAVRVTGGQTLILSGTANGPGGSLLFASNTATTRGGAVSIISGAAYIDSATFIGNMTGAGAQNGGAIIVNTSGTVVVNNSVFRDNMAGNPGATQGNGGAVAGMNSARIELNNVLFLTNTGFGLGGALFNNTQNAQTTVRSSTFANNAAAGSNGNGGAVALQFGVAANHYYFEDTLFTGNNAGSMGGAFWSARDNSGTIATSTFTNNTAASHGGAIALSNSNIMLTLTDVSFYGNTSGSNGGALYMSGNNTGLYLNVSASANARWAGNSAAVAGDGLFVAPNNSMVVNVDVGEGGSLDMLDPMYVSLANNQTITITKTGPGTWNLGGSSTFFPTGAPPTTAIADFIVAEGTLHLYAAGETSYNGTPVAPGRLYHYPSGNQGWLFLTIKDGATLSAAGSNNITACRLTFEPDATFAFDLFYTQPGTNILTLSLSGGNNNTQLNNNNWTQYLDLGDLNAKLPVLGTYNLMTRATDNTFAGADTTLRLVNPLPDNYHLQVTANGRTLQLVCDSIIPVNSLLTWTGAGPAADWLGGNWKSKYSIGLNPGDTFNYFRQGDIVNLLNLAGPVNVNSSAGLIVAGLYVSGSENTTITGAPLTGDPAISLLADAGYPLGYQFTLTATDAATGKLVLGQTATSVFVSQNLGAVDPENLDPEVDLTSGTTIIYRATAPFTGTLTLANGSNNFPKGIDIHSGALVGNDQTLGSGTAGILDNGTLIFDQAASAAYPSPITGTGALVKTGTGALTLAATAANFTGNTEILAGSLLLAQSVTLGSKDYTRVTGTTPPTPGATPDDPETPGDEILTTFPAIHVATGAAFGGAGTTLGSVTLDAGASLQVGTDPLVSQTMTIGGDLALDHNAILDYQTPESKLLVAGTLAFDPAVPNIINLASFQSGTFNLGNLAALYTTGSLDITVNGIIQYPDARQNASLATNGNDLLLIGIGDISRILYWTGSANNTWALTKADWQTLSATDTTNVFGIGDRVYFTDIEIVPVVTSSITVAPSGVTASDMYVDGTTSYTFTGGAITTSASSIFTGAVLTDADGQGKLHKTNTGTLTLANGANNFIGGIALDGGALAITGTTNATTITAAPNTTLQLGAKGILATDTIEFLAGSTLAATGTKSMGTLRFANLTTQGTLTANIDNAYIPIITNGTVSGTTIISNTLALTGNFTNASILKTGAGELMFSATVTGNGVTELAAGSIRFAGFTRASSTLATHEIILNGGTLAFQAPSATVSDTTANDWTGIILTQGANAATTTITGVNDNLHLPAGDFAPSMMNGINVIIDPGARNTTTLSGTASNFTGLIRVDSGTFQTTDFHSLGALAGAKIALNGGELQISATGVNSTASIDLRAPTSRITVDDGYYTEWGTLTKSGAAPAVALIKAGSGTLALTGASNAANNLIVDQGRVIARTASSITGTITVNPGGVFELSPTTPALSAVLGQFGGATFKLSNNGASPGIYAGSGTLAVTNGHISLTNALSTIEHINVTGTSTNPANSTALAYNTNRLFSDFAANGTITVDQASLVLVSNIQTLGDIILKNGASFGFLIYGTGDAPASPFVTNAQVYKTGTINSLANLGPTPANLYFNTNVALGRGDLLVVKNPIAGDYNIGVYNYGDLPQNYTGAIELLRAPDSPGATFTLITPEVMDIGLYQYAVTATTTGGAACVRVTGIGTMSNLAGYINSMCAALPETWFSELDSVAQRLGELHFDDRGEKGGFSVWTRGYGEKLNFNTKLTGATYGETHYAGEAGADFKVRDIATNIYIGAFMGYGNMRRDYNAGGDGNIDSVFGGLYATLATRDGLYLDATLKFNDFKNHFTAITPTGQRLSADYHNTARGFALETGKHFDTGYGMFFEPMLQGAITSISRTTYLTDNGMGVMLSPGTIARARIGFRLGRSFETERHGQFSIYVKGYGNRQWMSDGHINVLVENGAPVRYAPKITGNGLTGGAGIAWLTRAGIQAYLDFDTTQNDFYIKPWSVNFGLRYAW